MMKQAIYDRFHKKTDEPKTNVASIEHMRETQEEADKKRPPEDLSDIKLAALCQEAHQLQLKLDARIKAAKKQEAKVKAEKAQMIEKKKKYYNQETGYDENKPITVKDRNEKYLFKTIMCPLGPKCPKLKKNRWPAGKESNTLRLGCDCPFAHGFNEINFPQSYDTKIACAGN